MTPKRIALLAVVALVAPAIADAANFSIEALYGISRPPAADFRSAVSGTVDDQDLSDDSAQIVGGTVLLNFGLLELGAIVDVTLPDKGPDQTAIGALGGVRLGDKLRLDLLGEIGGQRYGNAFEDHDVITGSTSEQWLMYVGLRPGVAYKFGLGKGSAGIVLGVWGFARWDLTDGKTSVSAGDSPSLGEVDLGGTTIGATARLGIEF
ncbi:MAG TPA: hypothetical protein VLC54_06390 [Anaeromyxobacter sp.]|nr:hypothetical protein [Anaeromyxobacter sp.]